MNDYKNDTKVYYYSFAHVAKRLATPNLDLPQITSKNKFTLVLVRFFLLIPWELNYHDI